MKKNVNGHWYEKTKKVRSTLYNLYLYAPRTSRTLELSLNDFKNLPPVLVPTDCSTFLEFPPAKDVFKSASLFPESGWSILNQDLAPVT